MRTILNILIFMIIFVVVMGLGFWTNLVFIQSVDSPIKSDTPWVWWVVFTGADFVVVHVLWSWLKLKETKGKFER